MIKIILFSFSGAKEDRTPDLLNAIQALSQLSYSPEKIKTKINNFYYVGNYTVNLTGIKFN